MIPLQTDPSGGFPAGLRKRPTVDELTEMLEPLRTLYVHRPLKNAKDVIAWAKSVGFKKTLPAKDLHVTLAFSKTPVDWDGIPGSPDKVVVPMSPRNIEPMGDEGAVVLRFESEELAARWQAICNAGAVWDYPTFKPHITITYDAGDLDYSTIEPYAGPLEFGPEVFAEVKEKWQDEAKASLVGDSTDAIKNQIIKVRADLVAADSALTLALDRDSVREMDRDGRMRVKVANISKACVNPYKGHEIPDWEKLGLDPNRIYNLLRDPEELKKAAPSFNGVQILRKHTPVSAQDAQQWEVVGSTGTHAAFDEPYLKNSLSIWTKEAIDDIDSEDKRELSCGYHYRADMTPGEFSGMRFDGVMRDIVGNHVALVKDGRAGPDVVVGDSNQEIEMSNRELASKIASVAARTVSIHALSTYLRPRLAMDAKISFGKAFSGVTGKNFKDKIPTIAASIKAQAKDKLAKDASLDDVEKVLGMLEKHEVDGGDAEVSEKEAEAIETTTNAISQIEPPDGGGEEFASKDNGRMEGLRGFLKDQGMDEAKINQACDFMREAATDEDPEEKKKREEEEAKKAAAKDEFPPAKKDDEKDKAAKDAEMKDMVKKPAMDAAIKLAVDSAVAAERANSKATHDALQKVRPIVGELAMAFDSAASVYRHVLKMKDVPNADKLVEGALEPIIEMLPKAGARPTERPAALGMDSAQVSDFAKLFPEVMRIQPGR